MVFRPVAMAVVVSLLSSCARTAPEVEEGVGPSPSADATPAGERSGDMAASGGLGQASGGAVDARFTVRSPFVQQGGRMTVALLAEYPGRPLHPASLLLLKLSAGNQFSRDGGAGSDSDRTYWHQTFDAAGDVRFPVHYELTHEPVTETLSLGTDQYSLEEGRVFLVDLTARPIEVTQTAVELAPLLTSQEPTPHELQSLVEKLAEQHEAVRRFTER